MSLSKSRFIEMFGNPNTNSLNLPEKPIKNVCQNLDYKREPITSSERVKGKYPYYGASGIVDWVDNFIFDDDLLLVSEDGENLSARVTPIAFSIKGKTWVNNHAHVLKFDDLYMQNYVEYFFNQLDLTSKITGTAQPKFLLQKILEKLELLKKSRFIEMFIEKRYPTASLDELSICGGEYGAQSSAIEYHPNRPRYVRITDINEDGSLNNDYASSANIKDDEQYRLKYGDFLFARMGATVGKTYAYTFGDQIYAGYLIRYRLNLEKILPEYLFAFTRLNCYWKWVSINQNGAAQPGINAKKYGSLHVPVPPIEEQKKFIELSQQIDKSKLVIQKSLEDLVGKS